MSWYEKVNYTHFDSSTRMNKKTRNKVNLAQTSDKTSRRPDTMLCSIQYSLSNNIQVVFFFIISNRLEFPKERFTHKSTLSYFFRLSFFSFKCSIDVILRLYVWIITVCSQVNVLLCPLFGDRTSSSWVIE